ncbi:MAG: sulfotransferase family 2 domain-containing protein [Anderseniella sp.]
MQISIRHKYVMFDVPKSASTSINFALRHISDCVLDGPGGIKHTSVADYERYLEPYLQNRSGVDVGSLNRLAVVREPLDMLASYYKYLRRPGVENAGHRDNFRHTCDISFDQFLEHVCNEGLRRRVVLRPSTFLLNADGKFGVDLLFSFARLGDLAAYLSSITGHEIKLPMKNVSAPDDVWCASQGLMNQVRSVFENDFILYDAIMQRPAGEPLRVRDHEITEIRQSELDS